MMSRRTRGKRRKTFFFLFTISFILLLPAAGPACADNGDLPVPKFKNVSVHDPSIIRTADGTFYIYGSHMAAARSTDLIQWTMFSRDAMAGCTLVTSHAGHRRATTASPVV